MSQDGPMVHGLRPEFRLLLLCAAPHSIAVPPEQAASLLGQVSNWPFLFSAADAHGIRMLFFRTLKAASYPRVPDEWRQACERGLQTQAERISYSPPSWRGCLACWKHTESRRFPTKDPF